LNEKDVSYLRKLFSDIIQGYTLAHYRGQKVLIKHFTSLDQGLIDSDYDQFFQNARQEGLPTSEERVRLLIEQGIWTDKDEGFIAQQKFFISNLQRTKSKLSWASEIEAINKQISEAETELNKKLKDKTDLIGMVAESFAARKLNESYIFHAFRHAKDVRLNYFDTTFFEDLSSIEMGELASLYNKNLSPFASGNLKKIGLAYFFQSVYSICDDNPFTFYGKAVCDLTFYQSEIFTYGRFFKSILSSEIKPDEETLSDPDKLIDWYMSSKNAQSMIGPVEDDNNGSTFVFGAKKSDITAAGASVAQSPVARALKEGKSLSMDEVIKHQRL
jgi:hypothetical protein